ncbi:MAG: hypothetical protein WDZ28_00985 [Simkaniaceae bacterium]
MSGLLQVCKYWNELILYEIKREARNTKRSISEIFFELSFKHIQGLQRIQAVFDDKKFEALNSYPTIWNCLRKLNSVAFKQLLLVRKKNDLLTVTNGLNDSVFLIVINQLFEFLLKEKSISSRYAQAIVSLSDHKYHLLANDILQNVSQKFVLRVVEKVVKIYMIRKDFFNAYKAASEILDDDVRIKNLEVICFKLFEEYPLEEIVDFLKGLSFDNDRVSLFTLSLDKILKIAQPEIGKRLVLSLPYNCESKIKVLKKELSNEKKVRPFFEAVLDEVSGLSNKVLKLRLLINLFDQCIKIGRKDLAVKIYNKTPECWIKKDSLHIQLMNHYTDGRRGTLDPGFKIALAVEALRDGDMALASKRAEEIPKNYRHHWQRELEAVMKDNQINLFFEE